MAMGYMFDKKILFKYGIPIYLILISIMIFVKKKRNKEIVVRKELVSFIFYIYVLALIGVTLFPISIIFNGRAAYTDAIAVNYVPFKSIANSVSEVGHDAFKIKLLIENVGGNFILLMPLGFLLPVLIRKANSFKKVLIICFLVSLSIETLQFLEDFLGIAFYYRIADVDDLILNTSGAAVGYGIYTFLNFIIWKCKNRLTNAKRIGRE